MALELKTFSQPKEVQSQGQTHLKITSQMKSRDIAIEHP
jgi:hypothetical protein